MNKGRLSNARRRRLESPRSLGSRLLFSGCRGRACSCSCGFFDSEGPMCFDFFTLRFGADDHGARFVAQFLRHLIRHGAGFRIKVSRNKAKAAHPHLHTAGLDLAYAAEVRFDKRQCRAHRFAVCRLCRQIFRDRLRLLLSRLRWTRRSCSLRLQKLSACSLQSRSGRSHPSEK